MAKPRPVPGLDPDRRLRPNARRILAVRIDEVHGFERAVADPSAVSDLHDMRIACKRLRYLLEIFAVAFEEDLEPFIDEVKSLQDLLGEIHDRDVQVPALEEHLAWLEEREAEQARGLLERRTRRVERNGAPPSEAAYRAFRRGFAAGRRADERPGIHALIATLRRERVDLYGRFQVEWRRLRSERFRDRLEAALGLR
jgi:hypothetical protein